MQRHLWLISATLLVAVLGTATALATWKAESAEEAAAAAAQQPEPMEVVRTATAELHATQPTTTAIGTVVSRRSVVLQNEVPGTVARVTLVPGSVVDAGDLLVQLDVAVEEAELAALAAQVALAESLVERSEAAIAEQAVSASELDRARAERDVALAQVARLRALVDRKTLRAPFRARVGLADVHPGQYLDAGTVLTTLEGVDTVAHVDFPVTQQVAASLAPGDRVAVYLDGAAAPLDGDLVAVDSRVDERTRTAMARARIAAGDRRAAPGASVRVEIPLGPERAAVVVPVSALRRGPEGDHVFVIADDAEGRARAHRRVVTSGPALGDRVVLDTGVEVGEEVATNGSFKLREAVLVVVDEETAALETVALAAH